MKLEATCGQHIDQFAQELVDAANTHGETCEGEFNGQTLRAEPGSDPGAITQSFYDESERRHAAYLASPEYAEQCRAAEEKERARTRALTELLQIAPAEPAWKDPARWQECVAANQDGYGGAVITYAHRWARLMEARIGQGVAVADCADELSHFADTEGITGFMYGCAVSILSATWEHGEELRRWHNLDTQIGTEGERANESGAVLNPALLSIGGEPVSEVAA